MSLNEELSVLLGIPPFRVLRRTQIKLLAFASRRLRYDAGETLIRQGEAGTAVFVVLEGEVEVSITSAGADRVVRRMGRNAFIGEISVMEPTGRTATVTAVASVVALEIERETLLRLIQDVPQLGDSIRQHMAESNYLFE